jgi:preprotein translocase subunit Sss1
MKQEQQPLYTLTIEEFITLTKKLIEEAVNESKEESNISKKNNKPNDEEFTILELATFLRCSKVSIHNYKKLGMPFYRIGRKLIFSKAEVLNFMRGLKHKRVITA